MNVYRMSVDDLKAFWRAKKNRCAVLVLLSMMIVSCILFLATLQGNYYSDISTSDTTTKLQTRTKIEPRKETQQVTVFGKYSDISTSDTTTKPQTRTKIEPRKATQQVTVFGSKFVDTLVSCLGNLLKRTPTLSNCYEMKTALLQYKRCLVTVPTEAFSNSRQISNERSTDSEQNRKETNDTVVNDILLDRIVNYISLTGNISFNGSSKARLVDLEEFQQAYNIQNKMVVQEKLKMLCRIILNNPRCLETLHCNLPCEDAASITKCLMRNLLNISMEAEQEFAMLLCTEEEGINDLIGIIEFLEHECFLNFVEAFLICKNNFYLKEVNHISNTCRNLQEMDDCFSDVIMEVDDREVNGKPCKRNVFMDIYLLYYKHILEHKLFKPCEKETFWGQCSLA